MLWISFQRLGNHAAFSDIEVSSKTPTTVQHTLLLYSCGIAVICLGYAKVATVTVTCSLFLPLETDLNVREISLGK